VLALFSVGCGGRRLVVGVENADSGVGALADAAPIPTSYMGDEIAAAKANCDAPHGNKFTPETFTAYQSHIVGAWYLCSVAQDGNADTSDLPNLSVVFTEDPNGPPGSYPGGYKVDFLVPDGSGGLVAGRGVQYEGYWSVGVECNGTGIEPTDPCAEDPARVILEGFGVTLGSVNSGGDAFFETSPTRLLIQLVHGYPTQYHSNFWYVPLRAGLH
jgi:hypothetical protein